MMLFKKVLLMLVLLASFEALGFPAFDGGVADGLSASYRAGGPVSGPVAGILQDTRTGLSIAEDRRLAGVICEESGVNGIDPILVMALIKTESSFYNWSMSERGAIGLMQILPSTGRWLAGELKVRWDGGGTLFNPYVNVKFGVYYLASLMELYGGDTKKTLVAYNFGPTRLDDGTPDAFAEKVLSNYKRLKERAVQTKDGSRK